MVVGLPADAAADAELPHHLEDRLVRYPRAQLGPQAHGYPGGAAPVRRPQKISRAAVSRSHRRPPKGGYRLGFLPVREPSPLSGLSIF